METALANSIDFTVRDVNVENPAQSGAGQAIPVSCHHFVVVYPVPSERGLPRPLLGGVSLRSIFTVRENCSESSELPSREL
jgi:hypothetical protein